MKPTERFTKLYQDNKADFANNVLSIVKSIAFKYKDTYRTFSTRDLEYANDVLTLRFLDTSFDKQMKDIIPLELSLNSLDELNFYSSKFNVLLLQFFDNPIVISGIISQLHLYVALLQEEDNLKDPKEKIEDIVKRLSSLN